MAGRSAHASGQRQKRAATSLLSALLDSLSNAAADSPELQPHVRAYCAWIKADDVGLQTLGILRAEAESRTGGARTYRDVAVLGFAYDVVAAGTDQHSSALTDGIEWLAGREWFAPGRVLSFEADPLALLGVAVGVARATVAHTTSTADRGAELLQWLKTLLHRSNAIMTDSWESGLLAAASCLTSQGADTEVLSRNAPELAAALAARGKLAVSVSEEHAALDSILHLPERPLDAERAATQLVALRWLYRTLPTALPGRATIADVVALLKGVARSLRRWRWETKPSTRRAKLVRWEINNEYHVQDLLWVVLAPTFPDLEDEENLPSLGQKHPRYDLGVPSLQLIVEVKFVRRGHTRDFSGVIEQVAADASLYLRNGDRYTSIVAVVWDDSRRTEQHAELESGLLRIPGIKGVVILPRPGRMVSKPEKALVKEGRRSGS